MSIYCTSLERSGDIALTSGINVVEASGVVADAVAPDKVADDHAKSKLASHDAALTPPCKFHLLKYEHTYSCVQTCANVYQRVRTIC